MLKNIYLNTTISLYPRMKLQMQVQTNIRINEDKEIQ